MGLGFRIRGRTGGLSFACRLVGVLSVATPVGFLFRSGAATECRPYNSPGRRPFLAGQAVFLTMRLA